ncbi:MAG: penicillin-binding transpeptidase domain-containing protein [Pseudomonadota bacterium]
MSVSRKKVNKKKVNRRKPKANQRDAAPVLRVAAWRPALVLAVFGLSFAALVGRAFYLQILTPDTIPEHRRNVHLQEVKVSAYRGPIVDRHGTSLAVSMPVDSVWVNPREFFPDGNDRIAELGRAINWTPSEIQRRLSQHMHLRTVYLQRHMSPEQAANVVALGLPGVYTQREYRRFYPRGPVTGHVLGFTDVDDRGQEGLEYAFDSWMRAVPGVQLMLRDRRGTIVADVESVEPADPGEPLVTSLDLRIQHLAFQALATSVAERGAKSGSIVVVDVTTGELLAMVNQPDYNPNNRSELTVQRYRNRAVTDIFEPGSSLKPLIAAVALETGRYTPDTLVDTRPGSFWVGQKEIKDPINYGPLKLWGVLQKSSNVGIAKVSLDLPPEAMWSTLASLGFGSLTTSGFPGESAGLLNSYQHWSSLDQATLAYGYGLSVTPLQLAQAYATIGAGGVRYPVTFLKRDEPPAGERVLRESTATSLLSMLETVVAPGGTGTRARVDGYRVAGKTLTARKYQAGGYSEERHVTGFAGLAPATSPRLAVVVVIDEPSGTDNSGGKVAAPVFANVMSGALRLLAVAPDQSATMTADQAISDRLTNASLEDDS